MTHEKRNEAEWASVSEDFDVFEYMADENDGETYISGCLMIDDDTLFDYDGCFALPELVLSILREQGIDLSLI